ncbi:torsin-2A-like [Mizuhopecten yessoensis]|uniref:torsin-2A-like n=1 Tax=Mizuhopecten yessoensis TaxID=6573 RepID=UPI000B457D8F|nr:torsin-2A-like [Mizuhopecten yessoensis]
MDEEEPMDISGESFSLGSPTRLHRHSASRIVPRRQSFPLKQQSRSVDRHLSTNRTPKRMSMSALQSNYSRGYSSSTPQHLLPSSTELPSPLSEQIRTNSTPIRSLSDRFEGQSKTRRRRYNHHPTNGEEDDPSTSRKDQRKPFERNKSEPYISIKQKLSFLVFLLLLFIIINIVYRAKPPQCKMTVDIAKLKDQLKKNMFGQHIAAGLVMSLAKNLSLHFRKSLKNSQTVVSFHGWSGIGKNHLANILKQTFKPAKVNTFLVPLHFPHRSQDHQYQTMIPQWIKGNISSCSMGVFIFDEMDKASDGVIEGLRTALTQIKNSNVTTRVWTMFILLSNSRGTDINNYLFSQLQKGRERESLTQEEFMPTLINNGEGSWYMPFLEEGLITHTVPFLPLTQAHVKSCIIRDLYLKKMVPNKETIQKILGELPFNQPREESELYSTTGCKRVSSKVDLHMDD